MLRRTALLFLILCASASSASQYVHHELTVRLQVEDHSIEVEDQITIPADLVKPEMLFLLYGSLIPDGSCRVSESTKNVSVKPLRRQPQATDFGVDPEDSWLPEEIPVQLFSFHPPADHQGDFTFCMRYQGEIYHPIESLSEEYAKSFSVTPGIISPEGAFLAGSSLWIPWFNDGLITFNLTVDTPDSWGVVSQGDRTISDQKTRWESPNPVDETYLIAGKFHEYHRNAGAATAMVFLRSSDENLANKYLEATAQYLEMYRELLGPYPYKKFALIENFWETGYGMPSFTLLGPKVIRFPFILHSSYPHEILHNWWGNSVFVDYDQGNWCEGITVYFADHLIKEQRGQAVEYRRSSLSAYTDYVKEGNDFPLVEFRSRHDAATAAVGYNKAMMMYHMLRQDVGDELFIKVWQTFYRQNKFKKTTFDDIQSAFEQVTGQDYQDFFDQWTTRMGAPTLLMSHVESRGENGKYVLNFTLKQTQSGDPFRLNVPVATHLENQPVADMKTVEMHASEQKYELIFDSRPLRIDVDPQFDLFRKLHRNETPPSLSNIFGGEDVLILLPSSTEAKGGESLTGYKQLADAWGKEAVGDNEITELPSDRSVWIFGRNNRYFERVFDGISDYDAEIEQDGIRFNKTLLPFEDHAFVLSTRHPLNPDLTLVWLCADNPEAINGLARKLPHYGKYSYLAFEGQEPTNAHKGQWPVVNSPMSSPVASGAEILSDAIVSTLPKRKALAELPPVFSADRMMQDVAYLASEELEGRGFGSPGLDKAADYIEKNFRDAGLEVSIQSWQDVGGMKEKTATLKNIIGIIPGTNPKYKGQSVVISAHYDHLGWGWPPDQIREGNRGQIHPGAEDNASGISVLLELARTFGEILTPDRTVIFVAFTAEECGLRGSKHYVENMTDYPIDAVIGNINLDSVGRLGDRKLLILGASSASEWKHIAMGVGFVTGIQSETVTKELGSSDHVSFIRNGAPAIHIFGGPHEDYHRPTDTIDKIDPDGMVKAAMFAKEAALYLVEREEPLTFVPATQKEGDKPMHPKNGRKVGTGCMPDFSFSGQGMKIGAIAPGSPAENAGLQKDDVIILVGDMEVSNLQEYTNALKNYNPGDKAVFRYVRNGQEKEVELQFTSR
ncbi:MAG: hypothetical protein B6244_10480 [Candidatus Cloacimonetes bacterium 4572_55]|nr:MAG: hypothetical protein B6244_10480 [Candidatus Cloacimonetes bacterium 4572_55]